MQARLWNIETLETQQEDSCVHGLKYTTDCLSFLSQLLHYVRLCSRCFYVLPTAASPYNMSNRFNTNRERERERESLQASWDGYTSGSQKNHRDNRKSVRMKRAFMSKRESPVNQHPSLLFLLLLLLRLLLLVGRTRLISDLLSWLFCCRSLLFRVLLDTTRERICMLSCWRTTRQRQSAVESESRRCTSLNQALAKKEALTSSNLSLARYTFDCK